MGMVANGDGGSELATETTEIVQTTEKHKYESVVWNGKTYTQDGDDLVLSNDDNVSRQTFNKTLGERDILFATVLSTGYLRYDLEFFLISSKSTLPVVVTANFEFEENKHDDMVFHYTNLKAEKNKWIQMLGENKAEILVLEEADSNCFEFLKYIRRVFIHSFADSIHSFADSNYFEFLKYIRQVFIHSFAHVRGSPITVANWKLLTKERDDLWDAIPLAISKLDEAVKVFNETASEKRTAVTHEVKDKVWDGDAITSVESFQARGGVSKHKPLSRGMIIERDELYAELKTIAKEIHDVSFTGSPVPEAPVQPSEGGKDDAPDDWEKLGGDMGEDEKTSETNVDDMETQKAASTDVHYIKEDVFVGMTAGDATVTMQKDDSVVQSVQWDNKPYNRQLEDVVLLVTDGKPSDLWATTLAQRRILYDAVVHTGFISTDLRRALVDKNLLEYVPPYITTFFLQKNKPDDNITAFNHLKAERNKWIGMLSRQIDSIERYISMDSFTINTHKHCRLVFLESFVRTRGDDANLFTVDTVVRERNFLLADFPFAIQKRNALTQTFNAKQILNKGRQRAMLTTTEIVKEHKDDLIDPKTFKKNGGVLSAMAHFRKYINERDALYKVLHAISVEITEMSVPEHSEDPSNESATASTAAGAESTGVHGKTDVSHSEPEDTSLAGAGGGGKHGIDMHVDRPPSKAGVGDKDHSPKPPWNVSTSTGPPSPSPKGGGGSMKGRTFDANSWATVIGGSPAKSGGGPAKSPPSPYKAGVPTGTDGDRRIIHGGGGAASRISDIVEPPKQKPEPHATVSSAGGGGKTTITEIVAPPTQKTEAGAASSELAVGNHQ